MSASTSSVPKPKKLVGIDRDDIQPTIDTLKNVLLKGTPVVSVPTDYIQMLGGDRSAAMLLAQLIYWQSTQPIKKRNGYFPMPDSDITHVLGMGSCALRRARIVLKQAGLINHAIATTDVGRNTHYVVYLKKVAAMVAAYQEAHYPKLAALNLQLLEEQRIQEVAEAQAQQQAQQQAKAQKQNFLQKIAHTVFPWMSSQTSPNPVPPSSSPVSFSGPQSCFSIPNLAMGAVMGVGLATGLGTGMAMANPNPTELTQTPQAQIQDIGLVSDIGNQPTGPQLVINPDSQIELPLTATTDEQATPQAMSQTQNLSEDLWAEPEIEKPVVTKKPVPKPILKSERKPATPFSVGSNDGSSKQGSSDPETLFNNFNSFNRNTENIEKKEKYKKEKNFATMENYSPPTPQGGSSRKKEKNLAENLRGEEENMEVIEDMGQAKDFEVIEGELLGAEDSASSQSSFAKSSNEGDCSGFLPRLNIPEIPMPERPSGTGFDPSKGTAVGNGSAAPAKLMWPPIRKSQNRAAGKPRKANYSASELYPFLGKYNELKPTLWGVCEALNGERVRRLNNLIAEHGEEKAYELWQRAMGYFSADAWWAGKSLTIDSVLRQGRVLEMAERNPNVARYQEVIAEQLKKQQKQEADRIDLQLQSQAWREKEPERERAAALKAQQEAERERQAKEAKAKRLAWLNSPIGQQTEIVKRQENLIVELEQKLEDLMLEEAEMRVNPVMVRGRYGMEPVGTEYIKRDIDNLKYRIRAEKIELKEAKQKLQELQASES